MSGRHKSKKSKKPVIIAAAAVIVVAIVAVCVIIFVFSGNKSEDKTVTTNYVSTIATEETVSEASTEEVTAGFEETTVESIEEVTTSESESEKTDEHFDESSDSKSVVVPAESGNEVSYFSGSYTPYMAVDTSTGSECSLKEVFGSSYADGGIVFKSDGSFSDTLIQSSANSGAYAVSGDSIIATYTNDKNLKISVSEWNGDVPSEFVVDYGGYDVYFS